MDINISFEGSISGRRGRLSPEHRRLVLAFSLSILIGVGMLATLMVITQNALQAMTCGPLDTR
jgi:hypothetical protein